MQGTKEFISFSYLRREQTVPKLQHNRTLHTNPIDTYVFSLLEIHWTHKHTETAIVELEMETLVLLSIDLIGISLLSQMLLYVASSWRRKADKRTVSSAEATAKEILCLANAILVGLEYCAVISFG